MRGTELVKFALGDESAKKSDRQAAWSRTMFVGFVNAITLDMVMHVVCMPILREKWENITG